MINLTGNLTQADKDSLLDPTFEPDTTDIPLKIFDGEHHDTINIENCYMGIRHVKGGFFSKQVRVKSFVNDGIAFQGGIIDDIELDLAHIINDLDFRYSKKNHNDCIHSQTDQEKYGMTIRQVILEVSGKGAADKGNFIKSETGINDSSILFTHGFKITRGKTAQPAFNSNNERNGTFGSPQHPLCGKKLNGLSFRIWGKKPNSPPSYNNIIHIYDDVKLELDESAKKGTTVRIYKRNWTLEERLDNYYVFLAAQQILRK